jgi:hypothetical protein
MKYQDILIALAAALAAYAGAKWYSKQAAQRQAAAIRYGVSDPASQQARMLAAQDAAFYD